MSAKPWSPSVIKTDLLLLVLTIVFLYFLVFKFPGYPFFFEADHLIFLYNADRMYQGEQMYRDFFQFTFPGAQTVYLLMFLLFGPRYWVLGLAIILIGSVSFWVCLRISRQVLKGPFVYLPAVLFIFFGMRWFGLDGTHRMFSPIFVLLAIWILLKRKSVQDIALAGVFCAAASFFTQQRGVVALFAIAIFLIADNVARHNKVTRAFKESLALGLGFIVALAVLCGYFIYTAGLNEFIDSTLIYPAAHYGLHPENTSAVYLIELGRAFDLTSMGKVAALPAVIFHAFIVPFANLIFFAVFLLRRKTHGWEYWRGPMLLAIVGSLMFLGTPAPMHQRFFSVSAPSIILLIWVIAESKLLGKYELSVSRAVTCGLLLLGIVMAARMQTIPGTTIIDTPSGEVAVIPPNDQFERFIWLRDNTKPGDLVYEVYQPFVYFPLQLRNPTRMAMIFPYGITPPEHVEEVIRDLKKNPPPFILWDNSYNKPIASRSPQDHTAPLSEYVLSEYEPTGETYMIAEHPIQIWQRKIR